MELYLRIFEKSHEEIKSLEGEIFDGEVDLDVYFEDDSTHSINYPVYLSTPVGNLLDVVRNLYLHDVKSDIFYEE